MDYIHSLKEGTSMLTQAVGILQGTRWDGSQQESRQYLMSMDMDLAFASGLVADMEASNFTQVVQDLANNHYATTGYKSIAIWVRKFGFEANLVPSGDLWEITIAHEEGWHDNPHGHRHINRWGCAAIIAFIIAAMAFLGIWFFTGSIWAAIYFFEMIFEFLLELADMFG